MKNILLFIAIIITPIPLFAQKYERMLNSINKYFYSEDGLNTVFQKIITVDSVSAENLFNQCKVTLAGIPGIEITLTDEKIGKIVGTGVFYKYGSGINAAFGYSYYYITSYSINIDCKEGRLRAQLITDVIKEHRDNGHGDYQYDIFSLYPISPAKREGFITSQEKREIKILYPLSEEIDNLFNKLEKGVTKKEDNW